VTFKVLVATWNLREFAGSELVAWEVAEHFAARGHDVTLFATTQGAPMSTLERAFTVTTDASTIDLPTFDLVWSQHQLVVQFPSGLENCVRRRRLPKIVAVSLSPFLPAEHVDSIIARSLGAELWANSEENAGHASEMSRGLIPRRAVRVFHNAAPDSFWEPHVPPASTLNTLLVVSNHIPHELGEAIRVLQDSGIEVRVVGVDHERVRVDRALLDEADAVVTIGKTVVDAIAAGRPAYIYDHYGGSGWLNSENFHENRDFNFSGRPHVRKLSAAQIAQELVAGYSQARAFSQEAGALANGMRLSEHLDALLDRTPRHRGRWRAFVLGVHFVSRTFRAHLATVRRLMPAEI